MLIENEDWDDFIDWLSTRKLLAVDTETTGLYPFHGSVIAGVSVGTEEMGFYISFGHGEGFNHNQERLHQLTAILNQIPRIVMFNGTFDLNFLSLVGLEPRKPDSLEEVQVAAHLHNENDFSRYLGRKPGLKELADKYLGPGSSTPEHGLQQKLADVFGKRIGFSSKWKGSMWNLPASDVEEYASADAVLTMKLRNHFVDYIRRANMGALYREICNYTLVLQQMCFRGIAVSQERTEALKHETWMEAGKHSSEFRRLVNDGNFNLNSAKQLHTLFESSSVTKALLKAWIEDWSKEQEDPDAFQTTTDAVLEQMEKNARLLPVAKALLNFRDAYKMHSTYFAKYLPLIDPNGKIHGNFNVIGTETGRLSAWSPNLQAIPRDVEKHKVKMVFTPSREGGTLIEMDYSQAEMRLASFYGSEFTMAEILNSGVDLHQATADLVGCDRTMAKRINFSAIYGIGPKKFAATYNVPFEDAKVHLANYHAAYPGFRRLYSIAEHIAKEKYALILPSGRIRHYFLGYGLLEDENERFKVSRLNLNINHATHKASSNLVQGMVAAVTMRAMLRIHDEVPELQMVLTVHDSLIFDAPPDLQGPELDAAIFRTQQIMEDPCPEDINFRFYGIKNRPDCRMKVDVKTSQECWGEAKEWKGVY